MKIYKSPIYFTFLLFIACQNDRPKVDQGSINQRLPIEPTTVQTVRARQGAFMVEVVTNGVLSAGNQMVITAKAGGEVSYFPWKEGDFILKDQLLLKVTDYEKLLQLEQAKIDLKAAVIDKNDLLIQQGGSAFEDSSVTKVQLDYINLRSNYTQVQHRLKTLKYQLEQLEIFPPFSGIIANIEVKRQQRITVGQEVCLLLDPDSYEAIFQVMESDALAMKLGQEVKVCPIANEGQEILATIASINPIVSEAGLVEVKAKLKKSGAKLLEGMNVRVIVQQRISNQIVVPKSAVVLRSAREVVFTLDEATGRAVWNYVKISRQNSTEVVLSEGVSVGEKVIVEGNATLAHDTEVTEAKIEE